MPSKAKNQMQHAKRRFRQRLGIELTPALNKALLAQIQDGVAELVEHQSRRVSVFKTTIEGQQVRLVYDKNTKVIVTLLF